MTESEVSLNRPEVFGSFRVIFCFFKLKTLPYRLEILRWNSLSLLTVCSCLGVVSWNSWSLSDSFAVPSSTKNTKFFFELSRLIFAVSIGTDFRRFQILQFFVVGYQNIIFPNSSRDQWISSGDPCKIKFWPNWRILALSLAEVGKNWPLLETEWSVLWMVLRIVFHTVFFHHPRGLGHFADRYGIPCLLSKVPSDQSISWKDSWYYFLSELMNSSFVSFADVGNYPLVDQMEKLVLWKTPQIFVVCQEVLDISQVAIEFHRIRPPLVIRSGLQ